MACTLPPLEAGGGLDGVGPHGAPGRLIYVDDGAQNGQVSAAPGLSHGAIDSGATPDRRHDAVAPVVAGTDGELSELHRENGARTVIAEISPGVAVVFGPSPLDLELVDFGFVTPADLAQVSNVLSAVGNTATVAGNVGQALSSLQGLYRVNDATRALLTSGAKLAVKDGANLGTMITSEGLKQARFIPVTGLTAAQTAAAIGPAVATIALQMQLSEITSLVKTNVALTRQVHEALERDQRAELAGLLVTIDRAVARAKELESVPASLWDTVAGCGTVLWKQHELHRERCATTSSRSDPEMHEPEVTTCD